MSGGGHPHPGLRTEWFLMHERPARPGDYECLRLVSMRGRRDKVVRTWDGRRWRNPESGLPLNLQIYSGWRGLLEPAR